MNLNHLYMIAFALATAIIVYEDVRHCHRLPWPPRIIFTGLVFAMLDLLSIVSQELASVIAIGVVLAIFVNKGFVANCQVFQAKSTTQTTDSDIFLQSPTPSDQSTSTGGNLPKPGPGQILA